MVKRIRVNFETVNDGNYEKLDVGDFGARIKEQERLEFEKKKKKEQEEKDRINKVPCPVCKSTNKHHHTKYQSNGVYGPGASSWLVEDYLICLDCGVHFSDVSKVKK